jgi:peptide deformylase
LETLHNTESCAGLAATQLDIDEPPRIAILSPTDSLNEHLCLINPKIIETSGHINELEGCMSVYAKDIAVNIERAQHVKMQALDRYGKSFEIDAHDFLAKLIQHEIDHLEGITIIDRLSPLKRDMIKKKIAKLLRKDVK